MWMGTNQRPTQCQCLCGEKTKGSNGPMRTQKGEPQKGQQVLTEDHSRKSGELH